MKFNLLKFITIKKSDFYWAAAVLLIPAIAFLSFGEWEISVAWVLLFSSLVPALIMTHFSGFISVKILVWIALLTQATSMPMFYFQPDSYAFQLHRPYDFSGMSSGIVFLSLGKFLLIFVCISLFFEWLIKPFVDNYLRRFSISKIASQVEINKRPHKLNFILILLIICLILPLNNWMFYYGIGLTGISPPQLPYKLSGLLTYLSKFVIPLIISFLYIRTKRKSFALVFIMGVYSLLLGISTVSRSAALLVILAPWVYAFLDRRWLLFGFTTILASLSLGMTTLSREIVYLPSVFESQADTSLGLIEVTLQVFANFQWKQVFLAIPSIIDRLENFQILWLSTQFDPEAVGGAISLWPKIIDWSLADIDHNAVHIEFLGYTVPAGFYVAMGSIYSYALAASNNSFFILCLFSFTTAFLLIFQEILIILCARKYNIKNSIVYIITFLASISYIVGPGNRLFNFSLIFLISIWLMPKLHFIDNFFSRLRIYKKY